MKKLISIALVLIMVFAVSAISFGAAPSPDADKYYTINVDSEGNGTGHVDRNKIKIDSTGEYFTLTADPDKDGGYFTKWILDGDYEIISGDLYSPVLVIRPKSDLKATASYSVDAENLTMFVSTKGDGTATATPNTVKKGSDATVTLTAVDGKDTFYQWVLNCEYEIVSGSLTSRTLVIKPKTDVHVVAMFGQNTQPTEKKTDSNTSPKTGDASMMIIAMIMLAMGLGVFAVKKIKE